MSDQIAICYSANAAYLQHVTVAMVSFVLHNRAGYDLFLITDGISQYDEQKLIRQIRKVNERITIEVIQITESPFKKYEERCKKYPPVVFNRLQAPVLLAQYTYLMYLDSDTVVLNPLNFEFLTSSKHILSACKDIWEVKLKKERALPRYFNSGFLWINLHLWQYNKIQDRLENLNDDIVLDYADQDVLNYALYADWDALDEAYNYPPSKIKFRHFIFKESRPVVLHFIGEKPWKMFRWAAIFYWRYLGHTEYKKMTYIQLLPTLKIRVNYLVKKVLKKIRLHS